MYQDENIQAGVMEPEAPDYVDDTGDVIDDIAFNARGKGTDFDQIEIIGAASYGPNQDSKNL